MKASKPILLLLVMTPCAVCLGCSLVEAFLPQKPVYVPPGVLVELARDCRVKCWVTNKATGQRERRMVDAQGGWMLLRPRTDMDAPPEPTQPVPTPQSAPARRTDPGRVATTGGTR